MASFISVPHDNTAIELRDFLEIIEENKYDLNCPDETLALAKLLNNLNNKKTLLIDHFADELTNLTKIQKSTVYGDNTFILGRTKNFLIRAVIWLPSSQFQKDNIFEIYHDHNFDLLTVGHFGPGYRTEIFSYNNSLVDGLIGENVKVENLGVFTLSKGKILLYRAKQDIHNQIPPESISVSINVIPLKNAFNRPQLRFDKKNFQITQYLQTSSNELIVRLIGLLGSEDNVEPLKTILIGGKNPHLSAYAALSITQISPNLKNDVEGWVNDSNNKAIIDLYKREKNQYGSCFK